MCLSICPSDEFSDYPSRLSVRFVMHNKREEQQMKHLDKIFNTNYMNRRRPKNDPRCPKLIYLSRLIDS